MNNVLKQLGFMYSQELYSNVVRVCELTVGAFEQKLEMTPSIKCQMSLYYADSLFHLQEYVQAENVYRQILQFKKYVTKNKNTLKLQDLQNDVISDVEIKYKIYQCCMKLKQKQNAVDILQSIQARMRTPKINMALGNLYLENGMERPAIAAFKEVLRESPLALEAAENLLKLGVQGVEVNSLMLEAVNDITFLHMWLRGQAELNSRDYNTALTTFKTLDCLGVLKNNALLMINMAYCHTYMCNDEKAVACLQRAIHAEPNLKTGRDLLSTLLAKSNKKEDAVQLEKLLTPTVDMSLWGVQQWVVLGNYMYVHKKYEKALYFSYKATSMNPRNVEAILLKVNTLMQMGKYKEAALHCVDAQTHCPNRFDVYKCTVECYIKMNRLQEADVMANNACKQLSCTAQALTLHASVLSKLPIDSSKVIRLLEKAIAMDPTYSPAVFLLAEQYDQEQLHEEACALLLRHSNICPSSRVHQLIGDIYARIQKEEEACNHYCIALRLDSSNQRATEGLNNIGKTPGSNKRDSYYTSVGESSSYASQGPSASDHEQDADSDGDTWPNSSEFVPFD